MIEVIAEHSVETSLLPEKANILDAGCRGFEFANHFILNGHNVYTIDPDHSVVCLSEKHFKFALSDHDGDSYLYKNHDPQATSIIKNPLSMQHTAGVVECRTIVSFSMLVKIPFWDLIKLDIEGSEYEVIMSMDKAYAKQLSLEFHLHTGVYGDKKMREMEDKLVSLGYVPMSHEMTRQHGLGLNFWNSLWILQ